MADRQVLLPEAPAMRIDVKELLREPIGAQAQMGFDLGFQRLSDELVVHGIRGRLKLLRIEEGILVQGVLAVTVDLECGRCLRPVTQVIDVELDEQFVSSLTYKPGDDQVFAIDADHHIDLKPVLHDVVTVSMPIRVLCRPGCQGLCPSCGKDLNEGPCDCQADDVDPRLAELRAFIE